MENVTFKTHGTCSTAIHFTRTDDGKITNISFDGGCNGNLKGIAQLVAGMDIDFVIGRCKGNTCGPRSTSCPDQLAHALEEAYAAEQAGK